MAIYEDTKARGVITASAQAVSISKQAMGAVTFQLTGTFTATITFEAICEEGSPADLSQPSTNWTAVLAENLTAGTSALTATGAGLYRVRAAGLKSVRARCSAFTSGPINVSAVASIASP